MKYKKLKNFFINLGFCELKLKRIKNVYYRNVKNADNRLWT